MKSKTKRLVFLVCLAIVLVAIGIVLVLHNREESYSPDYQENDRDDLVVYDGEKYRYNEHLSNYLLMGIDTREEMEEDNASSSAARADAIFFLSYDRVKKTLVCISIPRDTMADVRMTAPDGTDLGTSKEHINMQFAFGDGKDGSCRLMNETVSALLYNIPIQGYCALNMDGITAAVDVLGGVEMTLPDNSLEAMDAEYVEGAKVFITKDNAERFVRYRDTDEAQSALARTNRQKELMKAVLKRAREIDREETDFIVDMYEGLEPYMITNMGNDIFAKLLSAKFDSDSGIIDVPGEGVEGEQHDEYHVNEAKLYELVLELFYEKV